MAYRLIVLFRNDLRLHDNVLLDTAARRVRQHRANEVLPLYCFDPRRFNLNLLDFTEQLYGGPKTGLRRGNFLLESVLDLKARLKQVKSDLVIGIGYTEEVIAKYLSPKGNMVLAQEEVTFEESKVDDAIAKSIRGKGELELHWGLTVYHADDVPFGATLSDFPTIPGHYLDRIVQKRFPDIVADVRGLFGEPRPGSLPFPDDPKIHKACQFVPTFEDLPFHDSIKEKGGETHGLAQLKRYVWGKGGMESYSDCRESMYGVDVTSKLSPWLSAGCVSPRQAWREIVMFEMRRRTTQSTISIKGALIYRDWTKFIAQKYGTKLFSRTGVTGKPYASRYRWHQHEALIGRWKEGSLGVPFIDAIMRELKETGYISNRGRLVVSNFFAAELWQDWRIGAAHFESCLIDYDAASTWVNWLISANLLNERNLVLNPVKKSMELDPDGVYIRRWVPEVASLSRRWIHSPWTAPPEELEKAGVVLGHTYPRPVKGKYLQ